jgi:uncharacterized membrane protein
MTKLHRVRILYVLISYLYLFVLRIMGVEWSNLHIIIIIIIIIIITCSVDGGGERRVQGFGGES